MRLFIAIRADACLTEALRACQEECIKRGVRGNYVPEENFHLTLAFIGEYPDPGKALEVIGSVPFAPFTLRLQGIGAFGDLWWAGMAENRELEEVVRCLREALSGAGIPFDGKEFVPHITLIRGVRFPEKEIPWGLLREAEMEVRHIALMRSQSGKEGVIYTEIG